MLYVCLAFSLEGEPALAVSLNRASQLIENANTQSDLATFKDNIHQAIEIYQDALQTLPDRGGLYYNLGHCYALLRQPAHAIAAYRKALQCLPGHGGAHNNLQVMRRLIPKLFQENAEDALSQRLLFFHHWTSNTKEGALQMLLTILLLSLWARQFWRHPAWVTVMSLSALAFLMVATSLHFHQEQRGGVVIVDQAVAYLGNGTHFERAFSEDLPAGIEFELIEQRSQWVKVRFANNLEAWLPLDKVSLDLDKRPHNL